MLLQHGKDVTWVLDCIYFVPVTELYCQKDFFFFFKKQKMFRVLPHAFNKFHSQKRNVLAPPKEVESKKCLRHGK